MRLENSSSIYSDLRTTEPCVHNGKFTINAYIISVFVGQSAKNRIRVFYGAAVKGVKI